MASGIFRVRGPRGLSFKFSQGSGMMLVDPMTRSGSMRRFAPVGDRASLKLCCRGFRDYQDYAPIFLKLAILPNTPTMFTMVLVFADPGAPNSPK